ncbi:stage V sporulation protein D [Candidatus Formimonas warabiya]|uniref:stage V sporulation protein D n=1 Tax=Formimonas warabiya TaxID=1761012 RepID=UPI0011D17BFA|nr:stage V sporulation protein D [Candidatus Formimonas warabiya]
MQTTTIMMRRRIACLFFGAIAVFFLLLLRLAYLQFALGSELQLKAEQLRMREIPIAAKRGTIYDRNHKKLAVSVSADSVYALPPEVKYSGKEEDIAKQLSPILGIPQDQILKKITAARSFEWLQRKVDFAKAQKIKQLDLPGIKVVEESQRFYPKDTLASHVLGFAGVDNQGLEGIEITRDAELKGVPGNIVIEYDAKGRELPGAVHKYNPPVDGNSLVLTIDETIQYFAERELDKAMNGPSKPKSATIIVMQPKTGEILALANRPTYDSNNYAKFDPQTWRNIAVSNTYEPGSTFKIITTAAALEEGVVKPDDRFYDPGYIVVGDRRIRCWRYYNPHGSESFREVIQNSCNPGFVEVGLRLENKEKGIFYKYIKAFGIGATTSLGLPGEAPGIMIPEKDLKPINIATISIGQSIAVTPLQIITAASAVANGGVLMEPQIVREVVDANNKVIKGFQPKPVRRVISEQTAQVERELLEGVVSQGTGRNGYVPGYRVGGKTGTAQKPGPGGYQQGKYVASFLGMAPVNDPQLVVLVILDEPQGYPYQGGQIAAPVFKAVMEDSLRYLGVVAQYAPGEEDAQGPEATVKMVTVPEVINLSAEEATKVLKLEGLKVEIKGTGKVVTEQTPAGLAKVKEGSTVLLRLGTADKSLIPGTVTVPDLTGKRIREVADLLGAMGLKLDPEGRGAVVRQEPIPGSKIKAGDAVKVYFSEEEATEETIGP